MSVLPVCIYWQFCVFVGTIPIHFYELMQFLQSAYSMCKSLASRGLAKQTMRFVLGLGYATLNSNCQKNDRLLCFVFKLVNT